MKNDDEILGCFVSTATDSENDEASRTIAFEKGRLFRTYLWGEIGIAEHLKRLKYSNYGKDLKLILFQFYVNPIPYLLENLKAIEEYRRNEKSIGIPIIINDNNFFNKSEVERYRYLKKSILSKIELLTETIKKHGLDTNIKLLKSDITQILS